MINIDEAIAFAKDSEKWSANHKFNYGPIMRLEARIFNDGTDREHFKMFYDNLRHVTDPKTYMAFEFAKHDIYVRTSQLTYLMKQAFPEVDEGQVTEWLSEFKEPHHVIIP